MNKRSGERMHRDLKNQADGSDNRQDVDDTDINILQDFIEHVRGVVPLLENLKYSIEESSSRIPKASVQLTEVTSATESATVEILNVVEEMTARIEKTEQQLKSVELFVKSAEACPGRPQAELAITAIAAMLAQTRGDSTNIAIALQVQDITSQQIAGVASTIESIRIQLSKALKRFDEPEIHAGSDESSDPADRDRRRESTHFDGDAQFSKMPDRQNLADEIIKQWNEQKTA